MLLTFACLANLLGLTHSASQPETSVTGAILEFPYGPAELSNVTIPVAPAQFGIHDYGGSLEGFLVLPANPSFRYECPPTPVTRKTMRERKNSNMYIYRAQRVLSSFGEKFIMVIDRGHCYFVDKVKHAENLGANGVLVLDTRVERYLTMWPTESFDPHSIDIPSVALRKPDAMKVVSAMGVKNWDIFHVNPGTTVYPNPNTTRLIVARVSWGVPHPDDRVEWELWTSSNDDQSIAFIENFAKTSVDLDLHNQTLFTPHYFVINGSHYNCTAPNLPCRNQCTNSGRYCMEDPEHDLIRGLSGYDVLRENLRQMCVWKHATKKHLSKKLPAAEQKLWWDYVTAWNKNCYQTSDVTKTFNAACSKVEMDKIDKNLWTAVQKCIGDSGGYEVNGGVNTMFEAEVRYRDQEGIFQLPTVRINQFQIHGRLSCKQPIYQSSCQVFKAICAGFAAGTAPKICSQRDVCVGSKDCEGQCGGDWSVDACGNCRSPDDSRRNSCLTSKSNIQQEKHTALIIVSVVASLVVLSLCLMVGIMYRRHSEDRSRFNQIMTQYQVLDDMGDGTAGAAPVTAAPPGGQVAFSARVPTDDGDDESTNV